MRVVALLLLLSGCSWGQCDYIQWYDAEKRMYRRDCGYEPLKGELRPT